MNAPSLLVITGACLIMSTGIAHLYATFFTRLLVPVVPGVSDAMARSHPALSDKMSMWNLWICFNATHALGSILFGIVYGTLAWRHMAVLALSPVLQLTSLGFCAGYYLLANRYMFKGAAHLFLMALATHSVAYGMLYLA